MPDDPLTPTPATELRRHPERGHFDRATIDAILDEALSCHLAFVVDGRPFAIPTIHARIGDRLYVHGSPASRMLRAAAGGTPVCVTATLIDGLVLARSAMHHSLNFRSVLVMGTAVPVDDPAEKVAALDAIVDHVLAGRSAETRPPDDRELRATSVLRLPITEASAKVRTGGPIDDEADLPLDVWAGVLPLAMLPSGPPVADPALDPSIQVPPSAVRWVRGSAR